MSINWKKLAAGFISEDGRNAKLGRTPEASEEVDQICKALDRVSSHDLEALRLLGDRFADVYHLLDFMDPDYKVDVLAYLAGVVEARRPRVVVDAGCAIGSSTNFLAAMFPEVSFVGYDLSPKMVEKAAARALRLMLVNVRYFVAAHDGPKDLAPGSVDLVIARGSLGPGARELPFFERAIDPFDFLERTLEVPAVAWWVRELDGALTLLSDRGAYLTMDNNHDRTTIASHVIMRRLGFNRDRFRWRILESQHALEMISAYYGLPIVQLRLVAPGVIPRELCNLYTRTVSP